MLTFVAVESRADQKFKRLDDGEIRSRIVGNIITDDVHWSDYFRKDGSLISVDMGRTSVGAWRIRSNELCIYKNAAGGNACYQVWVAGDEVSLRLEGIDPAPVVSYIRKYEGQ